MPLPQTEQNLQPAFSKVLKCAGALSPNEHFEGALDKKVGAFVSKEMLESYPARFREWAESVCSSPPYSWNILKVDPRVQLDTTFREIYLYWFGALFWEPDEAWQMDPGDPVISLEERDGAKLLAKRVLRHESYRRRPRPLATKWIVSWVNELLMTKEERSLRRELDDSGPLPTAYYLAAKDDANIAIEGIRSKDPPLTYDKARRIIKVVRGEMFAEFKAAVIFQGLRFHPSRTMEQAVLVFEDRYSRYDEIPYQRWAQCPPY